MVSHTGRGGGRHGRTSQERWRRLLLLLLLHRVLHDIAVDFHTVRHLQVNRICLSLACEECRRERNVPWMAMHEKAMKG
jgi:hypothetical protein